MPVTSSVFGNTSSDATSYSIATVNNTVTISDEKFTELMNRVNDERARRGVAAATQPSYTDNSSKIEASDLNSIKSALEASPAGLGTAGYLDRHGYQTQTSWTWGSTTQGTNTTGTLNTSYFTQASAYTAGFAGVSATGVMYAQNVNDMITKINNAAAVCMCNCNYCTCNCNYCTCNCNYACTCNCHY